MKKGILFDQKTLSPDDTSYQSTILDLFQIKHFNLDSMYSRVIF